MHDKVIVDFALLRQSFMPFQPLPSFVREATLTHEWLLPGTCVAPIGVPACSFRLLQLLQLARQYAVTTLLPLTGCLNFL
jgi:hypothetical protein